MDRSVKRPKEYIEWCKNQMKMFGPGNENQESQDQERMEPPVHLYNGGGRGYFSIQIGKHEQSDKNSHKA